MFHLYITLAYIIPNIYVFIRIKDLFISKGYRLIYTVFYIFTATIYPLTQLYSQRDVNIAMRVLSDVSDYILPFFLYLFLFVILFDLLLLFNLLFNIVSSETRKSFSFRLYALSSIILLSVAVVIAGVINMNSIRISEYQVEIPRRQSGAEHLRVAFVSDFHIEQNTSQAFVEQFVRKVNALNADILLYGGDMVEGDKENETSEAIESALRNIHVKYGSYGVTGNHEFYGGSEQGNFFRNAGIKLLCDTIVRIDNSLYLAGRYDKHFRKRKAANEILKGNYDDLPIILLDHRPTELQEVSRTNADIQFSGHTHDGQMFPINLITRSIYELSWGYKKIRNTHFFVSSGLRLWGPPVRTSGKSEIMLVDINFK
jgi:predicted MPP superfamily phosphohydrolase